MNRPELETLLHSIGETEEPEMLSGIYEKILDENDRVIQESNVFESLAQETETKLNEMTNKYNKIKSDYVKKFLSASSVEEGETEDDPNAKITYNSLFK